MNVIDVIAELSMDSADVEFITDDNDIHIEFIVIDNEIPIISSIKRF